MLGAGERRPDADDLERRSRDGPGRMRTEWLVIARHWRALQSPSALKEALARPTPF